ncbi:MAG: Stp1/IreP family PP2C-type Ser/Thr phosphatase [Clostridia bacterium]|nr:Stp1/IreP family PP2C-type Ser/Thr phosphatase [Clostridia bacterium]
MSRKYHFTRDTMKRLRDFAAGREEPAAPAAQEAPAPLTVCGLTHVGKVRLSNQDVLVESGELRLYGVADGMGGHNGGETASAGARDGVIQALKDRKPSLEALRSAVEEANLALFRQQEEDKSLAGMGTTLSLIWLSDQFVYMGHVGDSRIYLLRDGEMQQMTDDHSLVGELVRAGFLTPEQAENHPNKNVITRAVGTEEGIEVDLAVEERRAGDTWMICSDGLHGMVPDEMLEKLLKAHGPEKAAELMMEAALENGGRDNISVVVLHDGEGAR